MAEATGPLHTDKTQVARHRAFGRSFWMLNSIEMMERLAYFGIRTVIPVYIMQADDPGGLHLTAAHKGSVYAWWFIFQSVLPMFTGGFADRYGYKRVLAFSILMNATGYVLIAYMRDYSMFFCAIMVLATGTAFFKPSLQGSLAQNLTKENSSLGWGIFYWIVNVGAAMAPIVATLILGDPHTRESWRTLFIACAGFTLMNLLLLFTFRDVPSGADKSKGIIKVFWLTVQNIWPYWFNGGRFAWPRGIWGSVLLIAGLSVIVLKPFESGWMITLGGGIPVVAGLGLLTWLRGGHFGWQLRLPAFLLIMSGFWLMMYQLWDLHPNFIEDWVDSSGIVRRLEFLPESVLTRFTEKADSVPNGLRVPQQILLNLNAVLIVLCVIPISWLVRRMRTLSAMLIGMTVATGGIVVAGMTGSGWILLLGVTLFSAGEMLTGPKKNQYLGLIAPPGKKGLYLGYVNIPIGIGGFIGSKLAGFSYGHYGEKATLALRYLAEKTPFGAEKNWDGSIHTLETALGVSRTDAMIKLQDTLGINAVEATQLLWKTYNPQYYVWLPFAVIGVFSAVALAVYGQRAKRWADMNA